MTLRSALVIATLALVSIGGYFMYRDYEYRQIHGHVTEVGLLNFEQEVANIKDAEPVLVYFYKENEKNPADEKQNKEVADFAWRYAGRVKVVAINCAHLENLPLVIAFGGLRQPSFAFLSGDRVIDGGSGRFTTKEDLSRLLELLSRKP